MNAKQPKKLRKDPARAVVDRIDIEILSAFQENARVSLRELGERVGLAPSTCHERVRRLSESGAFRGFHALVHPAAAGIGLQAMVAVRLYHHAGAVVDDFEQFAISLPEVVATYHLTGAKDFLLHVAVQDDAHLRQLVVTAFADRAEVDHIETSLIFNHQIDPQWPIYARGEE